MIIEFILFQIYPKNGKILASIRGSTRSNLNRQIIILASIGGKILATILDRKTPQHDTGIASKKKDIGIHTP